MAADYLKKFDDDIEAERAELEFFRDRERWWSRRKPFRLRELDDDKEDVEAEKRHQEEKENHKRQREKEEKEEAERKRRREEELAAAAAAKAAEPESEEEEKEEVDESSTNQPDDSVGRIITMEERQKIVKDLVAKIPIDKEGLFAYQIKWERVNKVSLLT
jgi:hypothetical protein